VGTKLASAGGGKHRLDNLDISYELSIDGPRMNDPARRLLSLLGVLPSGVALQDIAAILPDVGEEAAHTLRQVGLAFDETDRLRVLAPLREHLQRNRQPADDDRKRATRHYCNLAAVAGQKVGAVGGAQAVQRLAPEAANIETTALQVLNDGDVPAAASAVLGWGEFIRFTGVGGAELLLEVAAAANARGLVAECAACTEKAGDIAFSRSDHAAARARYEEALPLYRRVGAVLGEANCIKRLGDIALERSDHAAARARYEEALPLYRRVGAVLGEANCIQRLGDIALARSDHAAARARYEEALALYERIEEPYSIGRSHQRLAGLASDSEERKRHIGAAREAWTRIDRPDLVAELPKEFGDAAAGP
jgi:hypothetical protein